MPWTHYTAPLTAGQELTSSQWYELCEALAERLAVTGQADQVDLIAAAAIRDAGVGCRGVPISTSGAAAVLTPWTTVLSGATAAQKWAESDTAPATLSTSAGNSFTTSVEWTGEGLSETEWGTLKTAVAAGWSDRRYWNIIRATILRLQIPIIQPTSSTSYEKSVSSFVSWADAMSLYSVAGETSSSIFYTFETLLLDAQLGPFGRWICKTRRQGANYNGPSVAALASCEVWSFYQFHNDQTSPPSPAVPDYVDWDLDGVTGSVSLVSTGLPVRFDFGTTQDLQGAFSLSLQLASYPDPTAYAPGAMVTFYNHLDASYAGALYIAPSWSKP